MIVQRERVTPKSHVLRTHDVIELTIPSRPHARTDHIDSYYAASANRAPTHPPLQGDVNADVCVVGGGIAGCSTALHLAERGYRVVLLEGRRIGWGASGRSGGQAITGFASGQHKLERQVGLENARRMWEISLEGLQLIEDRVARHSIDCDLHWGQMHVAIKRGNATACWKSSAQAEERYGYRTAALSRARRRRAAARDEALLARAVSTAAAVTCIRSTTRSAWLRAARAAGVQIYENSLATDVECGGAATVVATAQAAYSASFVVLCCNAYANDLAPRYALASCPSARTSSRPNRWAKSGSRDLMRENIAVTDVNFVLDYFRRSADHRLLFGGRVSYSGLDAFNTARATRKRMVKVFPQLNDVRDRLRVGRLRRHHA